MGFFDSPVGATVLNVALKVLFALAVLVVGSLLIKFIVRRIPKAKWFEKLETSVRSFALSLTKILLYAVLIVAVVGVLGIPMASVVAVLASAGLAVGLALQGALSNFAGGIMILIFKPFRVGDYISCASGDGTVSDISVIYTKLLTIDNKQITIPNSALMNNAVTNYSSEELRRVDMEFAVAYGEDSEKVRTVLLKAAESNASVKGAPEPEAKILSRKDNAVVFTLWAWCDSEDYWSVYFDLMEKVSAAFAALDISAPASKLQVNVNN